MIKFSINKRNFEEKMTKLKNFCNKNNIILREIGIYLIRQSHKCFKKQATPEGVPWAPFSPNTLYYIRKKDNKKIWRKRASAYLKNSNVRYSRDSKLLLDTHTLIKKIKFLKKENNKIEIGANLKYAPAHFYGVKKRNLPARPFLGITDNDKKNFLLIIKKLL